MAGDALAEADAPAGGGGVSLTLSLFCIFVVSLALHFLGKSVNE